MHCVLLKNIVHLAGLELSKMQIFTNEKFFTRGKVYVGVYLHSFYMLYMVKSLK